MARFIDKRDVTRPKAKGKRARWVKVSIARTERDMDFADYETIAQFTHEGDARQWAHSLTQAPMMRENVYGVVVHY